MKCGIGEYSPKRGKAQRTKGKAGPNRVDRFHSFHLFQGVENGAEMG
jgi:hypothetical protein